MSTVFKGLVGVVLPLLMFIASASPASAIVCSSPYHYTGYLSQSTFGGAEGYIFVHDIPNLPSPNDVVDDFIGLGGSTLNPCYGGHSCWIQMGVYQGNGSPGYEPDDSVYWETTTPYQSVGHYLFGAPYGSIFFTVWNSGSTDNFGNPDYFVYYHLEGDPTSHFIDDAHQNAWYESMEAQTEVRQDANATRPQIGQTDFGFPTTGPLTPTHGLSNAPYPAWPWTLWTSTSTKLETGPLAFHLVTWKPYWAFSTVDQ